MSRLQLFGSCFAYYTDLAYKAGVLASKRMIEVHYHLLVGDFNHLAVDAISVGCHHRHCGTYLYKLGVKLSVDLKQLLLKVSHLLGVVSSESFGCRHLDIKCVACCQAFDGLFKRNNDTASNAEYYLLGSFGINLMNKLLAVGLHYVEVIYHLDIFAGFNLFHNLFSFYSVIYLNCTIS